MLQSNPITTCHVLLADDDLDDCLLFEYAMETLPLPAYLSCVHNGEQLMEWLHQRNEPLPNVLFLDLNMPRKNGIECLSEIKEDISLQLLPVIIYSTSAQSSIITLAYTMGAHLYIRKPGSFTDLKDIIHRAISSVCQKTFKKPEPENFVFL